MSSEGEFTSSMPFPLPNLQWTEVVNNRMNYIMQEAPEILGYLVKPQGTHTHLGIHKPIVQ